MRFAALSIVFAIGCADSEMTVVIPDGAQGSGDGPQTAPDAGVDAGTAADAASMCPALGCGPQCKYGVKRDPNGCETCQCNDAPADAGTDGGLAACAGDNVPSGSCQPATAPSCRLSSGSVCQCTTRCSGVRPPPGQEYAYSCATPNPTTCPAAVPMKATACSPSGLVCRYGTCGGSTATCDNGQWSVVFIPPPP